MLQNCPEAVWVVQSRMPRAPTNYGHSGECAFSTVSTYECNRQLPTGHRMQGPEQSNLQRFDGGHPAEERNRCQHRLDIWAQQICSLTRGLHMATCSRKTKIPAFASEREKLIMPPRSSFGRYLQWCQVCKQKILDSSLNSIVLAPVTHIVLNLASEGKIKPTHAWKMQNSITNVPISCSKNNTSHQTQETNQFSTTWPYRSYLVIVSHDRQSKSSTNVSYCQAILILERSCGSIKPWKTSASKHS